MRGGGGPPGRIVTFYSYKGGTGRSMALANVAWVLASAGKRVLVIDWDLEAPGLQRYFRPFLVDKELASSEGLVDFITDFTLEAITPVAEGEQLDKEWYVAQADLLRYAVSLDWDFPAGGLIDFVPAGRQGPDYAARFAAINWQNFYERLGGGAFFEAVKERVRSEYDYVLIDSRTGVSDTAGICTIQMPDTLVVCFTFNNQSIEGASSVTRSAYEQHRAAGPRNGFRVVPVPTRVDLAERDKLEQRKLYARWKFDPFIERIPAAERKAFWGAVEVPYIPYFSYEEILAPFREDASDPKTCLAAFVRLAGLITDGAVSEYVPLLSPEERQQVLQEFAQTPAPADETAAAQAETETAIERYLRLAELACAGMDDAEQKAARRLWTRLVRVPRPEEGAENSKVRVHARDLGDVPASVVEKFADAGLVAVGRDEKTDQSTFESASEELLRGWKRLLGWIEEDREFLLWRQKLQATCAAWEAKNRAPFALLEERSLNEALIFFRPRQADLNATEIAYIQASLSALQQKQKRYRRAGTAAAAALLVLAMLGFFAVKFFLQNREQAQAASTLADQAEQLIQSSRSSGTKEPNEALQTGLLLAVESQRMSPNGKAEGLLRENLPLLPRRVAVKDLGKNVERVALSADGKRLIAVTGRAVPASSQNTTALVDDRAWQVLDVETGQVSIPANFEQGTTAYEISPDGKYLAVAGGGGAYGPLEGTATSSTYPVEVTDLEANRKVFSLTHAGRVNVLAFSPDGRYLATASRDGTTKLLDLRSGKSQTVTALSRASERIFWVTFSGDGRTCANLGQNPELRVWRIPEEGAPARPAAAIKLGDVGINPLLNGAGDVCAVDSLDGFKLFDVASGKPLAISALGSAITKLAFDVAGRYVVAADNKGNLKAWNVAAQAPVPSFPNPPGSPVYDLIFSQDDRFLATPDDSRVTRVWPMTSADHFLPMPRLLAQGGDVNHLAFSVRGGFVATGGADNVVRVWNLERELKTDAASLANDEPCARLRRSLTFEEWRKYFPNRNFGLTCEELAPVK